jgi:hypothetical protein
VGKLLIGPKGFDVGVIFGWGLLAVQATRNKPKVRTNNLIFMG